jgi:2-keto-4-pentenoate hydratase
MDAQLRVFRELVASGAGRVGWKIGINDPNVQQRLELCAPVVGYITGKHQLQPGDSAALEPDTPYLAELEIGLRIGSDLAGGASVDDARAAIAAVNLAIEVQDYRYVPRELDGIVAHNIFHRYALFSRDEIEPLALDLSRLNAEVWINDVSSGRLDPALVTADLGAIAKLVADTLAHCGETLCASDRILSGSVVQPLRVRPGDRMRGSITGLGSLELKFASGAPQTP